MEKGFVRRIINGLQAHSGLLVVIVAAILVELVSIIQYLDTREGIRQEVQQRAESELHVKRLEIKNVMTSVEVAVENMAWVVEQNIDLPEQAAEYCRRIVNNNPHIVGCGLSYVADYFPRHGHWYELYTLSNEEYGAEKAKQIGSKDHDYLTAEWFTSPLKTGKGYWSEPYFDNAGAKMLLCTYALPLHNKQGKTVAVIGVDVPLEWLNEVIARTKTLSSSYNLLLSRTGKLIACPEDSLVMRTTVQEVTRGMNDTMAQVVNQRMINGEKGKAVVIDNEGNKNHVFFAPMENETGWSMSVVCSDKEMFSSLEQMGLKLMILRFLGLSLLAFIIYRMVCNFKYLQEANAEKERIGSELRIANGIQMGMVPKVFTPHPDRNDISVYATMKPAKEVGGDLYDFYIRDEKMFFCVGDVSGKGVPASLVMAVTRSMFRIVSNHESAPERIVRALNDTLNETNETNMFVTLFVGVLDLPTGRLRYCNAGHCPPFLIGEDTQQTLKVETNVPIGIVNNWKYTAQETILKTNTAIFTYTDGVLEAENTEYIQFGEQRMHTAIDDMPADERTQPEALITQMTKSVEQFTDGMKQNDDLTMLTILFKKKTMAERLQRSITLPNDIQTIPQLQAFVEELGEELHFDDSTVMSLNLALEEAVVNVMNYAYPPEIKGDVTIKAEANDVRLKFTIIDNGTPFDPTAIADADITLSTEERPIGGLGIFMVRQIMDSINYERVDGQNILSLRKKLPADEATSQPQQ